LENNNNKNFSQKILGLDIGGTNIRSGFVDIDLNVSDFALQKTSEIFSHEKPSAESLALFISSLIKDKSKMPAAISIGMPSTVDRLNRFVYSTPNIKGLDNIDLASCIEEICRIPTFIVRDVNLLLLHDIADNKLSVDNKLTSSNNTAADGFILGFYIGTGLGNAISYGGKLIFGHHGVAGELGHIPALGKDGVCGCGNTGCIELYASGKYLDSLVAKHYSNLTIDEVLSQHSDDERIAELLDNIAAAIATEINILDPENVILGGGVIMKNSFPRKKFEEAILKHTRKPLPANDLRFIYSKESAQNGVVGAGIFGFQKISK
jgi:allose kinase